MALSRWRTLETSPGEVCDMMAISDASTEFRSHVTVGRGDPVAVQVRMALPPNGTEVALELREAMGAAKNMITMEE